MTAPGTFQPGLLRDRSVFITGGGSGINRQIALTCTLAGAARNFVAQATGMSSNGFRVVIETDHEPR